MQTLRLLEQPEEKLKSSKEESPDTSSEHSLGTESEHKGERREELHDESDVNA